ncbi:MAG: L-threonine 3-dehydrogenase [Chroococcidiopsis sp. SAG 2025]|nr:zinc-binding dehydrogenase [Chroococcidiopsis sp. SAG 2025]MDV2997841.1 L-threonine 3-dehydrogenase [Chroococcidiopsis sp. SAG 2025]
MNDKGGSYAQYVVVSEKTVAPMPDRLDMLMAGGLPIAGATALRNLEALGTGNEIKLMLWGASGGVGHVALQLAKRMGASVFAIASGADGVELVKQLGADEAVDGRSDDVVQRARAFAPDGFDTALVLVGGDDVQSTLCLVRRGGIIAFPNGVMPEPKALDGVELKKANGFADPMLFDRLNRLVSVGEFQVRIAQTFGLEEAALAHSAMKQHYLGKIVLRVSSESEPIERMSL